jgi:hypothetical protein
MSLCSIGLHDWQYETRTVTFRKNEYVTDVREEVFRRVCSKCGRVERNVGEYHRWVRILDTEMVRTDK